MASAAEINCGEAPSAVLSSAEDIAVTAHLAAPMRYAKDEKEVLPMANSRQSKSCRGFGSDIS